MNNYTTSEEFNSKLQTLQENFKSVIESDGFNWNEINAILMLKIKRNWTTESSNSNYQINSNHVKSFFPILQISESFPHWRMSMDGKVAKSVLTSLGEEVNEEGDWLNGKITYRHKIQNSYPYLQLTLEDSLRTLKNVLRENNQIYFLKKHNEDKYYILATKDSLYDDDKFLAIKPSLSESDNTMFHLREISSSDIKNTSSFMSNLIYYGPPGTGKTRQIQFNHLIGKDDSNSKFITFHQSYSYEEFIEGLKPIVIHEYGEIYRDDNLEQFIKYSFEHLLNDLGWKIVSRNIQESDSSIDKTEYKVLQLAEYFGSNRLFGKFDTEQSSKSLSHDGQQIFYESPIKSDNNEYIYLSNEWEDNDGDGLTFKNFERFVNRISDGIYSIKKSNNSFIFSQQSEQNSNVIYKIVKGVFYDACESAARLAGYNSLNECISDTKEGRLDKMSEAVSSNNVFVICIDEINRANISSVFGDLITLIEKEKRLGDIEEMSTILPYSKEKFGVPRNLQIIGTMNTADRSITLLDSALRRRFQFKEILPDPKVLEGIEIDGIKISELLEKINKRIVYFLSKDQSLGHSYFIGLQNSTNPKAKLLSIFSNNILPLLEEYFYNDIAKIRFVLGENNKPKDTCFYIEDEDSELEQLFGNLGDELETEEERSVYIKNKDLFDLIHNDDESSIDAEIFIKIYQ